MNNLKSTLPTKKIPYKLDSNWTWYKWKDLIESYQQGLIRSNSQLSDDYDFEYFKMNFIDEKGAYSFNNLPRTFASSDELELYKIKKGDFFINVRNSLELVGKCCSIIDVDRTILFNHMLVRIVHKNSIPSSYIASYFNTKFGKKLLDTCKKGTTTVIALYQKDIYELPIPIPNRKLLNYINGFINSINHKIEVNNKINTELEAMAKTLYDYWFVQFDFPNEEGKPYKSSGGKMVYNETLKREIPEGWEVKRFGDVFNISRGTLITKDSSTEGNYKVVAAGLNYSYLTGSFNREKYTITVSGSGANAGYVNFWTERIFASDCTTVRGNSDSETFLGLQFLKLYQNYIFSLAKGSAQPHVYPSDIEGLYYVCPPDNLIKTFGKSSFNIYEKISNSLKQNQELAQLRDWLLPMLMNGQISVE